MSLTRKGVGRRIIDRAVTREIFEVYIETPLASTLEPDDVVILDNRPVHKSDKASQILKGRVAWFRFLPPYGPDPRSDRNDVLENEGPPPTHWGRAPSTTSGEPSAESATSRHPTNVATNSRLPDIRTIKGSIL